MIARWCRHRGGVSSRRCRAPVRGMRLAEPCLWEGPTLSGAPAVPLDAAAAGVCFAPPGPARAGRSHEVVAALGLASVRSAARRPPRWPPHRRLAARETTPAAARFGDRRHAAGVQVPRHRPGLRPGRASPCLRRDNAVRSCTPDRRIPLARHWRGGPRHPTAGWWGTGGGPGARHRHRAPLRRRCQYPRRLPGSTGSPPPPPDGRPWGFARFPVADHPRPGRGRDLPPGRRPLGIDAFHLGHRRSGRAPRRRVAVAPWAGARNLALQGHRRLDRRRTSWPAPPPPELAIVADPYFSDGDYYSPSPSPVRGLGWPGVGGRRTGPPLSLTPAFWRAHQGRDLAVGGATVESYPTTTPVKRLPADVNLLIVTTG